MYVRFRPSLSLITPKARDFAMTAFQAFTPLFSLTFLLSASGAYSSTTTFRIINNCNFTVWPATSAQHSDKTQQLSATGFFLPRGDYSLISVHGSWSGAIWGRTECGENSTTGNFECLTGECSSNSVECLGNEPARPATRAVFYVNNSVEGESYYQVSIRDGYNLPIQINPQNVSCSSTSCIEDVNKVCPPELKVKARDNRETVACISDCDALLGDPQYCCGGDYLSFDTCKPSNHSNYFKRYCHKAYSYQGINGFTCAGAEYYNITFCPSDDASSFSGPRDPGPPTKISNETKIDNAFNHNKRTNQMKKYVRMMVPVLALFPIGIVSLIYYLRHKRAALANQGLVGALKNLPGMPREFQYGDLKKATNSFDEKNKLGRGGFGVVYKGLLAKENLNVAVKMFSRDQTKGQDDFLSELTIINRLRHKHLVPLLGWCHKKGRLLLVYEYMPNGSLDKHLFHEDGEEKTILEWKLRYNILVGVASALNYLHNEFNQKVEHRDLKASNIMLDLNYKARLGDFGLARALENEKTSYAELEGIPGTMGYIAPECFLTGKATRDSDIYGFGAVVLEIVCGQRPWTKIADFQFLVDWVWWLHREGRILDAVDKRLGNNYVAEEAQRLLLLGLACSHPTANERPKADSICQIMARSMDVPQVPPFKPAFVWSSGLEHDANGDCKLNIDIISDLTSITSCTMPR